MAIDEGLVMSVEAAAKALHISRNLAYEAVRRHELPSVRVGRRYLIPRRALERFLEQGGVVTPAQPKS